MKEGSDMSDKNIKNEYRFNRKFKQYIDKYCERKHIKVEEALGHAIARQAYLKYTEV